jgi:hypothetical protein
LLRNIFGPWRDEVTEGWRKLHNEELHNVFSPPSVITMVKSRSIKLEGNISRTRGGKKACRLLVGKPKGRRPLVRQRCRCLGNIMTDHGGKGWNDVDWFDMVQDKNQWRDLQNIFMNLWGP